MNIQTSIITLMLITGIATTATAAEPVNIDRWDRASAMAAVRSVNIDAASREVRTLKDLEALEQRSEWPLPAREASIYKFTQSLAALPRDAVLVDVMQYLNSYQSQVMVPHEDHRDAVIPLFNIRGAAAVAQRPTTLVAKFLESSNHSQRSGYLDALAYAASSEVKSVQTAALNQLGESPELTPLVAVTAVITTDPYAVRRLLVDGHGAGLAPALESLASPESLAASAAMLQFAIDQAPTNNAALAIASWWPALRNDAVTRQLLLDKLGDPALGSSVALALAKDPDIQTIRELQLIAAGDSATAQRAQLALNINRNSLIGEARK